MEHDKRYSEFVVLSHQDVSSMTPSTPSVNALTIAMRLLAVRDHSEGELRRKLTARVDPAFDAADIDAALEYCHEHGWLDDARFAQRYIHGRSRKGYGSDPVHKFV
ncbi:regulatory protein RecX [Symbiopectobacterium sp. Eva_TO]